LLVCALRFVERWQALFAVSALSPEVARAAQQQQVLERADERVTVLDREAVVYRVRVWGVAILAASAGSSDLTGSEC